MTVMSLTEVLVAAQQALPSRDQVQHMGAVSCISVLPALAGWGDAEQIEERKFCGPVAQFDEALRVKAILGKGGDGDKSRGSHNEQRKYCRVGEVWVDVGSFLENEDVAARSLILETFF